MEDRRSTAVIEDKRNTFRFELCELLQGSVGIALFKAFGGLWVYAGFLHLIECSLLFSAPLLMRELLKSIPSTAPSAHLTSIFWAITMTAFALSATIVRQQYEILLSTVHLYLSRSIQQLLYEKTLRLSVESKKRIGMGMITNLWINDTPKILQVVRQGHYLWGTPFQVCAAHRVIAALVQKGTH
jgi:ATP-binding cassette, subfamily C (CFTR/MRP), member 1